MEKIERELAHDLRGPLQMIYSCAQLIRLEATGEAGRYADLLMEGVDQLNRLLEDGLRMDAAALEPRNGDLIRCLRALGRRCQPMARARGVSLRFGGNARSLRMGFDETALCRVLLNLISNALRFTPPGGRIELRWRALGDAVEIEVSDTGPGIPADRQPYVFLRGETDGGFGLGLSSAVRLARAMGGELSLASAPGRGAAFTLRLPVQDRGRL